jgi:predicted transcriptional regulator
MIKEVIISKPEDQIEITTNYEELQYVIPSSVDNNHNVIGIITTDHISTLITRDIEKI